MSASFLPLFDLKPHRLTRQQSRILRLLEEHHPHPVQLPEVLKLGIAQYNARILELRELGYDIRNETEWHDGVRHSWFRLVRT
jgi:hypothetical protein